MVLNEKYHLYNTYDWDACLLHIETAEGELFSQNLNIPSISSTFLKGDVG